MITFMRISIDSIWTWNNRLTSSLISHRRGYLSWKFHLPSNTHECGITSCGKASSDSSQQNDLKVTSKGLNFRVQHKVKLVKLCYELRFSEPCYPAHVDRIWQQTSTHHFTTSQKKRNPSIIRRKKRKWKKMRTKARATCGNRCSSSDWGRGLRRRGGKREKWIDDLGRR